VVGDRSAIASSDDGWRDGYALRQQTLYTPGVLVLALLAFAIPLGDWQESLLGVSLPRILVPALFAMVLVRGRRILCSQLTLLIGIFVLTSSPSLIAGEGEFASIFANFVGYALLSIAALNVTSSVGRVRCVVMAYVFGLIAVTVFSFIALLTSFDLGALIGSGLTRQIFGIKRLVGTEENQNAFGLYFTCGIPIALYAYTRSSRFWRKAGWLTVLLAFIVAVGLTLARGPVIGGLIGAIVYLAYRQPRMTTRLAIFAVASIGLALVVWAAASSQTLQLLSALDNSSLASVIEDKSFSSQARFTMFWTLLNIYLDNPISGIGYGHLPAVVEASIGQRLGAHNIFLGIGIELGVAPLISFCAIVTVAAVIARRVAINSADSFTRDLAALLLAMLAGQLANGLVHESYINLLLWLNIALIGSLPQIRSTVSYARVEPLRTASAN
jgi:hypothetical protein